MSMYFQDIKNLKHVQNISLIFHPKIINKYGMSFSKGWGFQPNFVTIGKQEDDQIVHSKINKIKQYLVNLDDLPQKVKEFSELFHHEVLFNHTIPLKDNLLSIVCNQCDDITVKKILASNNYQNIKIITKNNELPSLRELVN